MQELRAAALLFDLDGTLISSLNAVERAWKTFALKHRLDPNTILEKIHGRRSIDSIRNLLPHVDAEAEDAFIRNLESNDTEGVFGLPGTLDLLRRIPKDRWAIVTSGTSDVATARCRAAGLPEPGVYVFGEEVINGKPAPDPFLLAAERLQASPRDCIGFEDTEAGLRSIASAGMRAVAIKVPSPYSVEDLSQVSVVVFPDSLTLKIASYP